MNRRAPAVALVSVVVLVAAPFVGALPAGDAGAFVLWQLRIPRLLTGVLVGGTLSLVGAALQALFANPLTAPSTMGTTAGATLGALAALVLGGTASTAGLPTLTLAAFAGGAAASFAVASLAVSGRARMNDVLLCGIAVTLAASALASMLQAFAGERALFSATQWSLGHLPQVGYSGILTMLPFVTVGSTAIFGASRGLQALAGGAERAQTQGVHVRRLRVVILAFGSFGVSACVATCGPIAFVGLLVPNLVRLLLGASLRSLLPFSWLVGAAFLVACDVVARIALPGREMPVGVITAGLGAPALMLLVLRRQS
jgi:ABC-type Fe3+-siderophore transport system permease subunit